MRIVLASAYLAAAALAVVLFDAHTKNGELEIVALGLWGIASVSLGWGTRQPLWSLLALAVIAFAATLGTQSPPVYHEAAITAVYAAYMGIASAFLVVVGAAGRMLVDRSRRLG